VNELIHNFLFLGKSITLNTEDVSPANLVDEALVMVKDKMRSGVEIDLGCRDGIDTMYCDREYMRLCVINLVINAVQAIEGPGRVRIECGTDDSVTYLSVSDDGEGIAEDELDKIFEPYYSTKKLGIGLGLAITKRFVEEHGGTISAASEIGKGTTMTIRIPRHER
jgi:signal transduction histidine kinase